MQLEKVLISDSRGNQIETTLNLKFQIIHELYSIFVVQEPRKYLRNVVKVVIGNLFRNLSGSELSKSNIKNQIDFFQKSRRLANLRSGQSKRFGRGDQVRDQNHFCRVFA